MNCSEEQRAALRKIKVINHSVVEAARNALVTGCLEQGYYIQFAQDIRTYGLWEALLYAEGYEGKGFSEGSAQRALNAALKQMG